MKEIVLYEDEDIKRIVRIWHKDLIDIVVYSKIVLDNGNKALLVIDALNLRDKDIIKIYHEIKEEG